MDDRLSRYGKLTLADVAEPALELASRGFPVTPNFNRAISRLEKRFREEWSSSAELYLPSGRLPNVGEVFVNLDWARTFRSIIEAEDTERRFGREAGLEAASRYFYEGPVAQSIVEYIHAFKCRDRYGREHHGLLEIDDLAKYGGRIEAPVSVDYGGYVVYKCGPWTQGPVFLQQLNLLEGFDLKAMGHNSVDYLHTLVECSKLAYADREEYYADPDESDVPLNILLSKDYATERRELIDPNQADMDLRPGMREPKKLKEGGRREEISDTAHLDVIDGFGNLLSATPSGGWITSSPVIPGLGFPLGTRAQMFHLDPGHPERLAPGKRPSTTLTPSLVMKDGAPYMVFGTSGGDQQDQWTLQLFLNHADFGMELQEALDAPLLHTTHFPGSFWPHDAHPGEIHLEERIPEAVREGLAARGHRVVVDGAWSHGRCTAIRYDRLAGVIYGAASPRTQTPYVVGW